ncbi:hypothetical protein [Niabella aquatica]
MKFLKGIFSLAIILGTALNVYSQNERVKIKPVLWEGMVVAGYADKGAFVNFGGPAMKLTHKPFTLLLGMLPSLRIKEDKMPAGAKKNAAVMPGLGAGVSIIYKRVALQVPLYYNAKTATTNGKWCVGIGLGYKL